MKLDKVQEAILNYDTYEGVGKYGVTSLETPRYKMKLKDKFPDENCLPPESRLDSRIGTGFHTFAEEAMNNSELNCMTEEKLSATISGYEVGGTCDLILMEEEGAIVCDFKTMKAYPAKKAFNGEDTDKFIKQLSLYAYMLRSKGIKTQDTGYIYVFVVGWTARDKAIPKTFRLELKLLSDEEVESYVKERIDLLNKEEVEVDCPEWMCSQYCELRDVCPHHNNHEFKQK